MEQINNIPQQVTVIPDRDERRQIRKRYNLAALVLIVNIVILNLVSAGAYALICMVCGGGFGAEAYKKGAEIFSSNELASTLFSCLTPIISETAAILIGIKILKLDFKPLATRDGYGGGTVMKLITLSLGLQTAAAFIAQIIKLMLEKIGLQSAAPDLSATTSFLANAILYFYACLLGPVLEELLYRGVLLQSMRKYNERFAIFLSAAIFGLMHQNYQQFVLGFLIGIPLAVVAIKYNSLIPSILTHIVVNTSGMLLNCLLQYTAPEYYEAALRGDTQNISLPDGAGMAVFALMALFRFGFLIAAFVVGIVSLVKGNNMTRPTPAGKARTRVFAAAALWWIVFAVYIALNFVVPFIGSDR